MRKLFGAVAILAASFLAAQLRIRCKLQAYRRIRALSQSLLILRGELSERRRSLRDCFRSIAGRSEEDTVREFYQTLAEEMNELGEHVFTEIWRTAIHTCLASMGDEVINILLPLGDCLGGSEMDRQCAALEKAAHLLEQKEHAAGEALAGERKLSCAVSLSLGAFLVIMLI